MTFEDASRGEIEFTIRATLSFIRGMINYAIDKGVQLDEFDGALSRPELVQRVMRVLETS